MSNYKLICLDLDRTLLNSKKRIDDETMVYLRQLQSQGVYICVATGRALFDAKKHAQSIGPDTFYLASNGAIIGQGDSIIYESFLSKSQKKHLFKIFDEIVIKPIFVTANHIYIYNRFHYIFHKLFYRRGQDDEYLKYVPDMILLKKIILEDTCKVHKVNAFPKWHGKIDRLKDALKLSGGFELAITPGHVFEITGQGISKGDSVKILADHLKINMSEVMAFGDSQNDISMLKAVGKGIAMANAVTIVKEAADAITDHHDRQGVLKALKKEYRL